MKNAHGDFEVNLASQSATDAPIGRMSIDKQFHGDLEATSKGEMLAFMTSVKGSAGYVAMEQITGTLNGALARSYSNTPEQWRAAISGNRSQSYPIPARTNSKDSPAK